MLAGRKNQTSLWGSAHHRDEVQKQAITRTSQRDRSVSKEGGSHEIFEVKDLRDAGLEESLSLVDIALNNYRLKSLLEVFIEK